MPTRARPVAQLQALASIIGTSAGYADVLLAVDADDTKHLSINGPNVRTIVGPRRPMLQTLNKIIEQHLPYYDIFGFAGDDVLYETKDWDVKVWNALKHHRIGVVYGDDGIQHEELPTHPWFTADLVRALGYASPPCLCHYYVDNFLKALTSPLGLLFWHPEIKTTHRHHSVGGLHYDKIYHEAEQDCARDKASYEAIDVKADIEKLKTYLEICLLTDGPAAIPPGSHTP